jgi:hypothetical protein
MRAHGSELVSKRDPKIARNSRTSWENWDFLSPKFDFLQRLSISDKSEKIFLNGFPISLTAFCFLQRIFTFCNGFQIFNFP